MTLLRLSLTTALALCLPLSAQAAVDAAGAEALTQQLSDSLKSLAPLEANGPVSVKPDGDAFAVILPTLTMKDVKGDFSLVTGPIALRMTPSSETNYKYTATLPTPVLTVNDSVGVPRGTVAVGEQQLTGEWDSANHLFPNNLSVLRHITFTDIKKQVALEVAELGAVGQVLLNPAGHADATASLNVRGIKLTITDAKSGRAGQVNVGALGIASSLKDYDLKALNQLREQARQLANDKSTTPNNMLSRVGSLLNGLPSGSGGGSTAISFTLNNFDLVAGDRNTPPTHVVLPVMQLSTGTATDTAQLTDMSIKYDHSGLAVTPVDSPLIASLLPTTVKLDIGLNRLPTHELLSLVGDAISTPPGPDDQPVATPKNSYQSAMALMEKSGTAITINQISYGSSSLNSLSSGSIRVSQQSPLGAIGSVNTQVNGISELVDRLTRIMSSASEGKPQAQVDPMMQGAMMGLSMMQAMGQQVPNAKPSGHVYKLEFTPEGSVTMNGTNLAALAGMAGGMGRGMGGGGHPHRSGPPPRSGAFDTEPAPTKN